MASPSASPGAVADKIDVSSLGGWLAYSHDDGIWISRGSGADARQITFDGGFDPTWSPDGRMIAYRRLTGEDDGEIWIVDADGRNARDLVNDPEFSDWGAAWSPDGRLIAYSSNKEIPGLAVWLMKSDGTKQQVLTMGHGEYPSWSPDGRQIVYAGGSYYDIHIVNVDGTGDHAITKHPAYEMAPAWSPDGEWIAYETQADYFPALTEPGQGPEMEIHLVRPDGSDDRRLTTDRVEDGFPTWSPDGRYLLWSRHGQLVVVRADGSGMATIGPGSFPAWRE